MVAHLVEAAHALSDEVDGGGQLNENTVLDTGHIHGDVQRNARNCRHGGSPQVIGSRPHEILVQGGPECAGQARQGQNQRLVTHWSGPHR